MSPDVSSRPAGRSGLPVLTTPPPLFGRAARLVERNVLANRRAWMTFVSGLFEPMFYLFALGFGVGGLVGDVVGPDGAAIPYGVFVAPGLLAAASMNGGAYETTFNVFAKLKWGRVYDAVLATPLSPRDVAVGEAAWALLRGAVYAVGFLAVALAAGLVVSPWAVLALPGGILIGFAFAGLGLTATTFMRSWQDFDLVQLVLLPLFLFSGTFFPIATYPESLQPLAHLSPLFHGVELVRGLMLGVPEWALLGHAAVLAALGAGGLAVASRRFGRLLLP